MAMTSILMALAVLSAASAVSSSNVVYNHQCIVGSPPACNRSLADDTLCRGTYSNNIKAWQSNDCDCESLSPSQSLMTAVSIICTTGTKF